MQFLPLAPELHPLDTTLSVTSPTPTAELTQAPSPFLTLLPAPSIPWRHPSTQSPPAQEAAVAAAVGPHTTDSEYQNSSILAALVESSLQTATTAAAAAAAAAAQEAEKVKTSGKFGSVKTPFRKLRRALGFPPRGLVGGGSCGAV